MANVWVGANTAAIKLVLAASSKDLKVEGLVIVPEVTSRELHSQCHLAIGGHDPPEMIQPAKDHIGFSSENASFGPREDRRAAQEKCCPAVRAAPPANSPVPTWCQASRALNGGLRHLSPWGAWRPT